MLKIAVLFDRFGPYHIARLEAATKYAEIFPIEIFGETKEYLWDKIERSNLKNRTTLFNTERKFVPRTTLNKKVQEHLSIIKPDVVAVNGWSESSALTALYWCLQNTVPAIVMSESAKEDGDRKVWREYVKGIIVKKFASALVGGIRHANYLENLGMQKKKIFFGYDVVDNSYFEKESNKVRQETSVWRQKKGLPQNFFLVVSRFIEKKNLDFVILAFHKYTLEKGRESWSLLILGDGPLKSDLLVLRDGLQLKDKVIFEGFKQYDELPIYFGLANAFIHASTIEQWGLVVNEAMASGLPVIVSEPCGCVPELVHDGINGYKINPYDLNDLTAKMLLLSNNAGTLEKMGQQSRNIISAFNTNAFGLGLWEAAKASKNSAAKKLTWWTSTILKAMANR